MCPYTDDFYKTREEGSRRSAKEIVPLVIKLIKPKCVIDVGCGTGTWLSVFREYGIEDIFGIDGDWVDKKMLQIPEERFLSFDLKKPFKINKKFDLVISLEVAEHLPQKSAKVFVDSLTRLGSVVLFSAAIPFQGGKDHLNNQWPEYWVKLFQEKDYVVLDPIRKEIWQNENVKFWYVQNILLFVRQDHLETQPLLKTELEHTNTSQLSLVHPKQYLLSLSSYPKNMPLKDVLFVLPILMRNALRRRIKKISSKK